VSKDIKKWYEKKRKSNAKKLLDLQKKKVSCKKKKCRAKKKNVVQKKKVSCKKKRVFYRLCKKKKVSCKKNFFAKIFCFAGFFISPFFIILKIIFF
jgi:hypothetical protein